MYSWHFRGVYTNLNDMKRKTYYECDKGIIRTIRFPRIYSSMTRNCSRVQSLSFANLIAWSSTRAWSITRTIWFTCPQHGSNGSWLHKEDLKRSHSVLPFRKLIYSADVKKNTIPLNRNNFTNHRSINET